MLAAWATACRPNGGGSQTSVLPQPSSAATAIPAAEVTRIPTTAIPSYPIESPPASPSAVSAYESYPPPSTAPYGGYPPPTPNATPVPSAAQFRGDAALQHAAAQMQWVPRDTGSPGWVKCGDYIAEQFKLQGWQVEDQFFEYQGVRCRNIIAKRGSGPGLIIGAHYDARRRADRDPDSSKQNDPVPAANDGASGVAVLLELARVLKPEELGREIWLAAFDAEDNGDLDGWDWIVGSRYMASNLSKPPEAVVVVDMIGDANQQIYYEVNSDVPIREAVWTVANQLGYYSFIPEPKFAMLDDHTSFLERGYRAIDIIDFDYQYWHTTADTLDKISAASLEAVGRTLEEWLLRGAPGVQQDNQS